MFTPRTLAIGMDVLRSFVPRVYTATLRASQREGWRLTATSDPPKLASRTSGKPSSEYRKNTRRIHGRGPSHVVQPLLLLHVERDTRRNLLAGGAAALGVGAFIGRDA